MESWKTQSTKSPLTFGKFRILDSKIEATAGEMMDLQELQAPVFDDEAIERHNRNPVTTSARRSFRCPWSRGPFDLAAVVE